MQICSIPSAVLMVLWATSYNTCCLHPEQIVVVLEISPSISESQLQSASKRNLTRHMGQRVVPSFACGVWWRHPSQNLTWRNEGKLIPNCHQTHNIHLYRIQSHCNWWRPSWSKRFALSTCAQLCFNAQHLFWIHLYVRYMQAGAYERCEQVINLPKSFGARQGNMHSQPIDGTWNWTIHG